MVAAKFSLLYVHGELVQCLGPVLFGMYGLSRLLEATSVSVRFQKEFAYLRLDPDFWVGCSSFAMGSL